MSKNHPRCPVCSGVCIKYGTTSTGRQRWRSPGKRAGSAIRASYGILVEVTTVQALARENDPSQVAGTDAFKNKGFGALVQAARESQEVFETITADPDNLDRFLEVLEHMIAAAKDEQELK